MKIAAGSLFFSLLLSLSGVAQAALYDKEVTAVQNYFNAYIDQNEKNIHALAKLSGAYERVGDAMEPVVRVRKLLQGRCPSDTKEKLMACLAKQGAAVDLLDFYVRNGGDVITKAKADVEAAGKILSQDVTPHLEKVSGVAKDFKNWSDVALPALKAQLKKDREALQKIYSAAFVGEFRKEVYFGQARAEAALLGKEIDASGAVLYARAQGFLAQHRLSHAKFTLESMQWLEARLPEIWKAISPGAQAHPRIGELKESSVKSLHEKIARLESELSHLKAVDEISLSVKRLRADVASSALSERDRAAFNDLFENLGKIAGSAQEVLAERGFAWLEAVRQ